MPCNHRCSKSPKVGYKERKKQRIMSPAAIEEPKCGQSGSIAPAVSGAQKVGNGNITPAVQGVPNAQCRG